MKERIYKKNPSSKWVQCEWDAVGSVVDHGHLQHQIPNVCRHMAFESRWQQTPDSSSKKDQPSLPSRIHISDPVHTE